MSLNPKDMRSIMDSITSVELNEAPLSAHIGRGINKVKASLGSNKSKGKVDNDQLAKKMDDNWNLWLGQTGKKGTLADLQSFLISKVGFNDSQTQEILSPFSSDGPIINQGDEQGEEQEEAPETQSEEPADQNEEGSEEQQSGEEPEENDASAEGNGSSEADIDTSINILNTYMTRAHLTNIKPAVSNKMLKAIKSIVKALPSVNGEVRTKGGNAAIDAIAALEYSDAIAPGTASEIQGYLSSAISNPNAEIRPFAPPVYDADHEDTPDPQPTPEPEAAPEHENEPEAEPQEEKPAPADQNTDKNERPRVRVPARTAPINARESVEYISEDDQALSSSEVYKIFKAASDYAYSNNLVGNARQTSQNSGGSQDGGYSTSPSQNMRGNVSGGSTSNGSGSSSQGKDPSERKYTKHLGDIAEQAAKLGIDSTRYSEIKEVAHKNSFEQIRGDDKATLSAIGYAFMRSM